LFNVDGQVVGYTHRFDSRTGGFMGMSFAIPIDLALNVKNKMLRRAR